MTSSVRKKRNWFAVSLMGIGVWQRLMVADESAAFQKLSGAVTTSFSPSRHVGFDGVTGSNKHMVSHDGSKQKVNCSLVGRSCMPASKRWVQRGHLVLLTPCQTAPNEGLSCYNVMGLFQPSPLLGPHTETNTHAHVLAQTTHNSLTAVFNFKASKDKVTFKVFRIEYMAALFYDGGAQTPESPYRSSFRMANVLELQKRASMLSANRKLSESQSEKDKYQQVLQQVLPSRSLAR
ncbi:hypothetical protein DPX16_11787 [Anabarilius grahami]|uniref:Uncharacterized protein n=1 Tax=Anabarilius grahami TaxID=495550 RepID=A0A3N0Z8G8_ANAGA|nr:hypothetical protein DPX16_11787 [Anabarilius grahami]